MFKSNIIRLFIILLSSLWLLFPVIAQTEEMPREIIYITAQTGESRGYTTTPQELAVIREYGGDEESFYANAIELIYDEADKGWNYGIDRIEGCGGADSPGWIDNDEGVSRLYSRALAYHLSADETYAIEVKDILERIMTENFQINVENAQCRLNFSWGIPEIVASADLIEGYWYEMTCIGPITTDFENDALGEGNCKALFQNWLAKNPYYIISLTAEEAQSNWGASATNTIAYIADYLWDRPEIILIHRTPEEINDGQPLELSPTLAYHYANNLMIDRMNGYRVEYRSSSACDRLGGDEQDPAYEPVKSQITPSGIIPDDARRDQYCNIPFYDNHYQNYPQLHIGHNIQQCELMLRRGDDSCYENIDMSDIPDYEFFGTDNVWLTTHLHPGRGSIERAINAIIFDVEMEWRHDSALEIAFAYYYHHHREQGIELWYLELDRPAECSQDACFGTLTHGFALGETQLPYVVILLEQ